LLIVLAAALSAALAGSAALMSRWPGRRIAAVAAGVLVAVGGWRVLADVWSLNEDFLPAISVGDLVCLLAGGLPPAVALAAKPLPHPVRVTLVGATAALLVNVIVV
jgi:hypothetical protein